MPWGAEGEEHINFLI